METEIHIHKVENGFVILDEDTAIVIEDKEKDTDTLTSLLFIIAKKFGYNYDKFGDENMSITFDKPGHKTPDRGEEEEDGNTER